MACRGPGRRGPHLARRRLVRRGQHVAPRRPAPSSTAPGPPSASTSRTAPDAPSPSTSRTAPGTPSARTSRTAPGAPSAGTSMTARGLVSVGRSYSRRGLTGSFARRAHYSRAEAREGCRSVQQHPHTACRPSGGVLGSRYLEYDVALMRSAQGITNKAYGPERVGHGRDLRRRLHSTRAEPLRASASRRQARRRRGPSAVNSSPRSTCSRTTGSADEPRSSRAHELRGHRSSPPQPARGSR